MIALSAAAAVALIGILRYYQTLWFILRMGYKSWTRPSNTFHVLASGKAATIKVVRDGKIYNLYVPYREDLVFYHINREVRVRDTDGEIVTITNPPGFPLLVSPHDLGVADVTVTDLITDDTAASLSADPSPSRDLAVDHDFRQVK